MKDRFVHIKHEIIKKQRIIVLENFLLNPFFCYWVNQNIFSNFHN